MQPIISVVMPSLNVAPYLRKCLNTVLDQTLREIEIICVDAGSTDGTIEILEEYAKRDDRISVIHSDYKSYGYQMNLGMDAAKGKYLGIVETDDYILPEMYEVLSQLAEENEVQAIKADFQIFYENAFGRDDCVYQSILNTLPLSYYNRVVDGSDIRVLEARRMPWAGIYSLGFLREKGIRFNESPGASYQDNGFWFQVYSQAERVWFCDRVFYHYRRDNPNASIYAKDKVFCICDEYDFIRNTLKKDPEYEVKYAPLCASYRFRSCMRALNRIASDYHSGFLNRVADDFLKIRELGELAEECFTKKEWNTLAELLDDPAAFYEKYRDNYNDEEPLLEVDLAELLRIQTIKSMTLRDRLQETEKDYKTAKAENKAQKKKLAEKQEKINTQKETIQRNRETIQKNKETIQKNTETIQKNKEEIKELRSELRTQEKRNQKDREKIDSLKENLQNQKNKNRMLVNSYSYRIGRMVTWLPRKIQKLLSKLRYR